MNKMLVAVFSNENKAFEGLSALKDLHQKGDITLYATAVVNKDEKGELHLNTAADEGPIGTTTGLLTGSLIGLIGGPVGLALGAMTGAMAGLIFDVSADDINTTFVDEVSNAPRDQLFANLFEAKFALQRPYRPSAAAPALAVGIVIVVGVIVVIIAVTIVRVIRRDRTGAAIRDLSPYKDTKL